MSTLWVKDGDNGWKPWKLGSVRIDLGGNSPREEDTASAVRSDRDGKVLLLPQTDGGQSKNWLLLWQIETRVYINGIPISSGIRCVQEKDEITVGSNPPVYFTREEPAHIKSFPGSEREITCAFCGRPIQDEHMVVECPGCGYLFHQSEDRQCYTYDATCRFCNTPTDLNAGPSWTPAEL